MMDRYSALLNELGSLIGVPLRPDASRRCKLFVNNQLPVYLEDREQREELLIASLIFEIPPGKFREVVLKEALKENNLPSRFGCFAFSQRANQLAFFLYAPYKNLDGKKLADLLKVFLEKAFAWRKGIETGQLPQSARNDKKGPSIFDIR